ncbi:MAG: hypothetical protein MK052_09785 [Alphaproteobacteria bacterium]|nr:hypothetical protein [Alphaproteobacteria bacterium]
MRYFLRVIAIILVIVMGLTVRSGNDAYAQNTQTAQPSASIIHNYSHSISCEKLEFIVPSFTPFIQQLNAAIASKDVKFLKASLDDNIKFDFSESVGKEAFMQSWGLDDDSQNSNLWRAMEQLIDMGGYRFLDQHSRLIAIVFPCSFQPLPANNWIARQYPGYSGYDYVVVTSENAALKNEDGSTVRMLQKHETLYTPDGLHEIVLAHDGSKGLVSFNDIRSPVDYRMFIRQDQGAWKISLFIQGD